MNTVINPLSDQPFKSRQLRGDMGLFLLTASVVVVVSSSLITAEPLSDTTSQITVTHQIDLETALKLAGARNLDIQIARERLAEARAIHQSAVEQFFPWLSPGISFRRHEGKIQGTEGDVVDASKQSVAAGFTAGAHVEIGDALYHSRETQQLADVSGHDLDIQRDEVMLRAVHEYFDLAQAQAAVGVVREAARISRDYEKQVHNAVDIGIAYKGDELRARVQRQRNDLLLIQALEDQKLASAHLARTLHLDAAVELSARDEGLTPLQIIDINSSLSLYIQQALSSRAEPKQIQAKIRAANEAVNGVIYGPMIPTMGVQAFLGEMGGGDGSEWGKFGESMDFIAMLSWRIGPGGLFDKGRIKTMQVRQRTSELQAEKIQDEIINQVIDMVNRVHSLSNQIDIFKKSLADAEETLRLSLQRQDFGVGVVLEAIQSEQELTRVRTEYIQLIAEYNKAQYSFQRTIGGFSTE
jgi:outer membrane protein TolC